MKPQHKKLYQQLLIGLLIVVPCLLVSIFTFVLSLRPWPRSLDYEFLNLLMVLKGGIPAHENILIIEIDPDSERKMHESYGPQWRQYHPKVIDHLKEAKLIAFDLAFYGDQPAYDKPLAAKMCETKNIVIATARENQETQSIPHVLLVNTKPGHVELEHTLISRNVVGVKPITLKEESEAIEQGLAPNYYEPSFLFRMLEIINNDFHSEHHKRRRITGVETKPNTIQIGLTEIPVDSNEMMYIRHLASREDFNRLNYYDVYSGNFDKSLINNRKIVIIGLIRKATDYHWTAYGKQHGVTLQALALNTVMQRNHVYFPREFLYFLYLLACGLTYQVCSLKLERKCFFVVILPVLILSLVTAYSGFWIPLPSMPM